MCTRQY
ncbi:uncharacterized protein FRV6_13006 [Fusarium oxysporum]|nr:uncharacterized protein FRV6_13006 [Fusarium oxysporum]